MNSSAHAKIAQAYLARLSTHSLEVIFDKESESKQASLQYGMNAQIAAQEAVEQAIEAGIGKIIQSDLDLIESIVKKQMLPTLVGEVGLYSVNGRVDGDDDDTHHIVEAGSEEEASDLYTEQMRSNRIAQTEKDSNSYQLESFHGGNDEEEPIVVYVNSCVPLNKAIEDRIA